MLLTSELRQAQMDYARAEVETTEAHDAHDAISAQRPRKGRDRSELAVRANLVLAVQNRLRARERKFRIRVSRAARKLKVVKAEESRLVWRDTVGIEPQQVAADDEKTALLGRFRQF